MRRSNIYFVVGALLMTITLPAIARACSCIDSGPPCQAYWTASAVFTGQVIQITKFTGDKSEFKDWPQKLVRFAVHQRFRGISGVTAETITGQGGGDCGYQFTVGQSYLVYAYLERSSQRLHASICSRTRLISDAKADLEYLNNLSHLTGGAMVFGSVGRVRNRQSGAYESPRPLADVRVSVEGNNRSFSSLTDEKGKYKLTDVPPGAYTVRVIPPKGLASRNGESKVEIHDRGCAEVGFILLPETSVSGKVMDEIGQPAAKIMVDLVPIDQMSERSQRGNHYVQTDENGLFQFNFIPPGKYFLGVRLTPYTYPPLEYPRTFYPGTADLLKAEQITVVEGKTIDGYNLQLPEKLRSRIIEGWVVWPDGRAVSDATVCFEEVEYSERSSCYSVARLEPDGHFSFSGFEGLRYLVRAHVSVGGGGSGQRHAEPVEVLATDSSKEIKLVISEPDGSCEACRNWKRKKP